MEETSCNWSAVSDAEVMDSPGRCSSSGLAFAVDAASNDKYPASEIPVLGLQLEQY